MRPLFLCLLATALAAAGGRDPAYDSVLAAYREKRWARFDTLAPAFLAERPDHEFAHSVRFMRADSLYQRKRYREAEQAAREYLRLHRGKTLEDRSRLLLVRSLNAQRRFGEALEALEGLAVDSASHERGRALEGLRRFDEAAEAYRSIRGGGARAAAFRRGVALFRGHRFDDARSVLQEFLERWPEAKEAGAARDYLARIDPGYEQVRAGVVLDYRGKYEQDPRFLEIRDRLPELRSAALEHIGRVLRQPPPEGFLVRFADAGSDRSGLWAEVRTERVEGELRNVLLLRTEHLVLDYHDLPKTLVHELYHCLQRERLGEEEHQRTPNWVREGCALYVAGQLEERARLLAGYVGANPRYGDPLGHLVDGLGGRHTLEDYVEDVCAFQAVEVRHGRGKAVALLRRLLETADYAVAIRQVLGEDFTTFERAAQEYARARLRDLVLPGRDSVLSAKRSIAAGDLEGALRLLEAPAGAYAPVSNILRARALLELGRPGEALAILRGEFLARQRHESTLLDDALLLELRALEATGSEEFEEFARRARLDLEPFHVYAELCAFLAE